MPARARRKSEPRPNTLGDCRIDPLLAGADREFLESFPRALLQETGAIPVRRYGGFGLVITRQNGDPALHRLQRESDVRLVGATALNTFAVDLFLRYLTTPGEGTPPLWVADGRKAYLRKLGGLLSLRGQVNAVGVLTSIILTTPLNHRCPLLVIKVGEEGQVLYLHGMGGLRVGMRFPGGWQKDLTQRLRQEFRLEGVISADGHLIESRGPDDHGLSDLTATVLPPLETESLILEPRGRRSRES